MMHGQKNIKLIFYVGLKMAAMPSKHVAKSFKRISTYKCVFYYIIVVSDVKYIYYT